MAQPNVCKESLAENLKASVSKSSYAHDLQKKSAEQYFHTKRRRDFIYTSKEVGKGTTFTVRIPLITAPPPGQ
jgi:hypothetical protein